MTLDEVQREPALLRAVKRAIDRDRSSGRFLPTGSANLLLMRQVSESLAGRASYLTLWPMTRREKPAPEDWRALARRGGFPTPALQLTKTADRRVWFDGYVRAYLERDLQDLAAISGLPDFRRLMRAACLRVGQLVNQTELGYWRTSIGEEVDFVIEAAGKLLPIEVKSTTRPRLSDAAHLRCFRSEYGQKARAGLLLHCVTTLNGWPLMCWPPPGGLSCKSRPGLTRAPPRWRRRSRSSRAPRGPCRAGDTWRAFAAASRA